MNKNITEANLISKLGANDTIFCEASGSLNRITVEDLSTSLGEIHTSQALKTYWNTGQPSTVLQQSGNRDVLIDYLQACKRYVFNASGTKKAEIAYVEQFEDLGTSIVHFVDGYSTTVNALNDAGCNWMVLRPELGFLSTEEDGVPVFYCAGRGSIAGGHSFPKKYVGMFKAVIKSNVLKSQPNNYVSRDTTLRNFITYAKLGGSQYGLYSFSDFCKENMIHLAYFGNTNYEENVGVGLIQDYSTIKDIKTGYSLSNCTNNLINYGTSPVVDSGGHSLNGLHFFGIEGLGEQFYEKLGGIMTIGTTAYVWDLNGYYEEAKPFMRSFNFTGLGGCIKSMIGGEYFDIFPKTVINDYNYNKYFCDYGRMYDTSNVVSALGPYSDGSKNGISGLNNGLVFTAGGPSHGCRLAFYGEPLEVGGSEILS